MRFGAATCPRSADYEHSVLTSLFVREILSIQLHPFSAAAPPDQGDVGHVIRSCDVAHSKHDACYIVTFVHDMKAGALRKYCVLGHPRPRGQGNQTSKSDHSTVHHDIAMEFPCNERAISLGTKLCWRYVPHHLRYPATNPRFRHSHAPTSTRKHVLTSTE